MSKLVEALERDVAWVELYRITGELRIPERSQDGEEEEDGELLAAAKQVRQLTLLGPFVRESPYLESRFCRNAGIRIHQKVNGEN